MRLLKYYCTEAMNTDAVRGSEKRFGNGAGYFFDLCVIIMWYDITRALCCV